MRYLTDPGWLGAMATIIAIAVSIVIYYASKQKKSLAYEILAENPLINIDKEIKNKLQIFLEGQPVENLHLLLVRFDNDGKLPIPATDYEKPITLRFKNGTRIIAAEYVSGNPPNLVTSLESNHTTILVRPILMNAGDSFIIKALLEQYTGTFDLDTRVVGVKALRIAKKQSGDTRRAYALGIIGALVFGLIVNYSLSLYEVSRTPPRITGMEITPSTIRVDTVAVISAQATGAGALSFHWSATIGQIEGNGPACRYVAPDMAGTALIELLVTDAWGRVNGGTIEFEVATSGQASSQPHFKFSPQ